MAERSTFCGLVDEMHSVVLAATAELSRMGATYVVAECALSTELTTAQGTLSAETGTTPVDNVLEKILRLAAAKILFRKLQTGLEELKDKLVYLHYGESKQ